MVAKVAATQANVLITGENGTGKEMIAREMPCIGVIDPRMMVTVDLGAVPETLFESELFGHVKGAFTDAHADQVREDRERPTGERCFLMKSETCPFHLQAKLLNVLQNRTITRLGESQIHPGRYAIDLCYQYGPGVQWWRTAPSGWICSTGSTPSSLNCRR